MYAYTCINFFCYGRNMTGIFERVDLTDIEKYKLFWYVCTPARLLLICSYLAVSLSLFYTNVAYVKLTSQLAILVSCTSFIALIYNKVYYSTVWWDRLFLIVESLSCIVLSGATWVVEDHTILLCVWAIFGIEITSIFISVVHKTRQRGYMKLAPLTTDVPDTVFSHRQYLPLATNENLEYLIP